MPPIMAPFATIKCPSCGGAAKFSFATYQVIDKKNLDYFCKSKDFEIFRSQHSHGGCYRAALYYPGLGNSLENIKDLPEGYEANMWQHPYWYVTLPKELENTGSIRCSSCLIQKSTNFNGLMMPTFKFRIKEKLFGPLIENTL